jgi:Predicted site-specific integrase-resolvase
MATGTIIVYPPAQQEVKVVLYARVSSGDQKSDLDRQIARLVLFANEQKLPITQALTEIGSGLNGRRPKLLKMLKDKSINMIIVEHRDRLMRLGCEYVEAALSAQDRRLIVIEQSELKEDLVRDMIEVLTSFCARLYGRRAAKNKAQKALERWNGAMRTVKRISHPLNRAKFCALQEVAEVFAKEKQAQLEYFQKGSTFARYPSPRQRRDELKSDPEKPDMPAHLRDCAIKDAFETELKYWAALAAEIRSGIGGCSWAEEQKHYAYWLLKVPHYLCAVITGRAPINEKIELTLEQRKQVQNYLRRSVRRIKGDRPRVRIVRSFLLDPSLYSVVDALSHDVGGQGISIVSLQSGKRIRVPLKGEGEIGGNIRIVLVPQTEQIEVHTTFELEHVQSPEGVRLHWTWA